MPYSVGTNNNVYMKVSNKSVVSLRYRMINSKGLILENTLEGPSIEYLHGGGKILPALEAELTGLKAGEEKRVLITKDRGYDGLDDEFSIDVIIDHIRDATEEELKQGIMPQHLAPSVHCAPGCLC
jgi:FKBP-type peptidyl-prolyl cis-trans isomerase SlyD